MEASIFARFFLLPISLIVLGTSVVVVSGQCQADQASLLLNLKGSLRFDESKSSKLVTWDSSRDCCDWNGVSCDPGGLGHVIVLDLSVESISGWSPSRIFSLLHHLRSLNLASNIFGTAIPDGLAYLTDLAYLNLSYAGFIGQVPAQLSEMENLVTLDLSYSSLTLENPNLASLVRNLTKLTKLYLDGMNLSIGGNEDDWCQSISSSLPNLQVLSLSNCELSGPIDASLKHLKFLSTLNLKDNYFSAQFPDVIFQVLSLETLDLSDNPHLSIYFPEFYTNQSLRNLILSVTNTSGELPQSIAYLKNLSRVELAGCNMTGTIPDPMANLTKLVSLDLSSNQLRGEVPSFHMSKNLTYLDLSRNFLTGTIPSFQMLRNLIHLSLSDNRLSGEIPSSYLQGVLNLNILDLSYNQFSGSIPASLFEIPSLQKIDLSFNQFGGRIPEFPSASTSLLELLDLSSNSLVGPIPRSVFNLSRLEILSLPSNRLNGSIQLDWVWRLANLTTLDLSHNTLTVEVTSTEPNLSSLPQFTILGLASCNLTKFPDLGSQPYLYFLDLSNNSITEVTPWLENFANEYLESLNLSHNLLKNLPQLTNIQHLETLDFHGNQLSGEIPILPPDVSYVDYSSNNFNSSIPLQIGKNLNSSTLVFFSLANNNLSGVIPESLCKASGLQVLDLSNNHLNGKIPTCLVGANTNLGVLDLRGNRLSGTIPNNFQARCGLQTLNLNGNLLHGNVPRTLTNCTQLEVLDLGNNQINDIFPCCLRDSLDHLRVLILRNNQFHGQIGCPEIQGSWDMLQILDLAQNQFNGALSEGVLLTWKAMMEAEEGVGDRIHFEPQFGYYQDSVTVTYKGVQLELVKILTYFTTIDLSCNRFEGPLPEAIGKFRALYLLNLSHNSFSGPILQGIGNLSQLESVDLSANNFSGAIPQQLATLSFLSFLNISDNRLTGEIPRGTQIQSFSASSFEDNAGLCGPPLPQSCQRTGESMGPPSSAHEKDGEDWQFMPEAGIGFLVGAVAVVAPLIYDRAFNRWCDNHVNRIYLMLVSYFSRV